MIKRVFSFKRDDWQHVGWLFRNMIKQAFKGEFLESYDAFQWIKFHFSHDSKRIDKQ